MKKNFIAGMLIVTSAFSFNAQAAGLGGAKGVREILTDYVKDIKKYAFEGKTSAAELNAQQTKKAQNKMMNDLKLSVGEKTALNAAISSAKDKAAVTNSIATILAAKNMSAGKNDIESQSIENAANASLKLMANASLIGEKQTSSFLNKTELSETREALTKLVAMPEKFITFETKERDSYTKTIIKSDELSVKSETFEEAFVKSIMETQKVSKDKAMEIVRKLKDCV